MTMAQNLAYPFQFKLSPWIYWFQNQNLYFSISDYVESQGWCGREWPYLNIHPLGTLHSDCVKSYIDPLRWHKWLFYGGGHHHLESTKGMSHTTWLLGGEFGIQTEFCEEPSPYTSSKSFYLPVQVPVFDKCRHIHQFCCSVTEEIEILTYECGVGLEVHISLICKDTY